MRHFGCFSNFDKYRPEAADEAVAALEAISSVVLEYVDMDVHASFGDSR